MRMFPPFDHSHLVDMRSHARSQPLDHLLLVQRHEVEVARLHALLRRSLDEAVSHLYVEHEHDHSCCKLEPWPVTMMAMIAGGGE